MLFAFIVIGNFLNGKTCSVLLIIKSKRDKVSYKQKYNTIECTFVYIQDFWFAFLLEVILHCHMVFTTSLSNASMF